MLWLKAIGVFLYMALRPLPHAVNTAVNVSSSVLGLTLFALIGANAGGEKDGWQLKFWPWGAFGLVIGAAVLISLAGIRLEAQRLRNEQVRFRLNPLRPEMLAGSPWWTQHIHLENDGPSAEFRCTLTTHVAGIVDNEYGAGVSIAWEQERTRQHHIGRGEAGNIRLLSSWPDPESGTIQWRFWVPSGSEATYAHGVAETVMGVVSFAFAVRDVGRDVARFWRAEVDFEDNGKPKLTLTQDVER